MSVCASFSSIATAIFMLPCNASDLAAATRREAWQLNTDCEVISRGMTVARLLEQYFGMIAVTAERSSVGAAFNCVAFEDRELVRSVPALLDRPMELAVGDRPVVMRHPAKLRVDQTPTPRVGEGAA